MNFFSLDFPTVKLVMSPGSKQTNKHSDKSIRSH